MAFLSMVDRRKRAHRELVEQLPYERKFVVPEAIPNLSVIEQMARHRAPVPAFAPRSPAAAAYENLWSRVRSGLADTR
jgi:cellulose biosynthesis protein BcsQ